MGDSDAFEAAAKEMAEEFATSFPTTEAWGLAAGALDFTKASLPLLDAALLKVREANLPPESRGELVTAAGAYLAEVIRRRSPVKLRWVPASVIPGAADPANPFLLATPKNLVFAVLGKPRALLVNGVSDSLTPFADKVNELCSREATAVG
jgi:hypothetical protein